LIRDGIHIPSVALAEIAVIRKAIVKNIDFFIKLNVVLNVPQNSKKL
jgi:hypothetical protein